MSGLILASGSYDRSIRVWSDNTPSRSLSFGASQLNCLTMDSNGRFMAAAGHGAVRVYELAALSAPHVSNEGSPATECNFTSLHFVPKPGGAVVAAAEQQQQQVASAHTPQILVATAEDGVVRVFEGQPQRPGQGGGLSVTQSSAPVGCPLLCSAVFAASRSSAASAPCAVLFAGSQAGIIFAWNISGEGSSNLRAPVLKLAVNRYPISAISAGNAKTGTHLVAGTTRGVLMSFWCDASAVSQGAVANAQTAAYAGGGDPDSAAAAGNNNGKDEVSSELMGVSGLGSRSEQQGSKIAGPDGGNGGNNAASATDRQSNADTAFDPARLYTAEQQEAAAAASAAAVFDGDALPLSTTVPLSVFRFSSIFRCHNRVITQTRFSPDGSMLATASSDCTVKIFKVPAAPAPGAIGPQTRQDGSLASTSNDTTAVEQMMKQALLGPGEAMWQMEALVPHQRWVWDCAFSANSGALFTASSDNSAWSWSLAKKGQPTKTFQYTGHQKPVTCICVFERQQQQQAAVAPAAAAAAASTGGGGGGVVKASDI